MSKFLNSTTRNIAWFKKAQDNEELQMKPPFQRNPVWTYNQKCFLIDSILQGFPVPELYLQEFVDEQGRQQHIVIDGQQRIRACLEFIEGKYSLDAEESPNWPGMKFDDLSPEDRKRIFGYTFVVRLLPDMPDLDIRAIFQRLNKNVVALNRQELRQATYWGPFISTMQELANYSYWSTTGIFSPQNVRRMLDVEYISELSIAVLNGHQNKKETLDDFYLRYEEEFDESENLIGIFQKVIFELEQVLPDIKVTRWKKKTDFYSLFLFFAEHVKELPLAKDIRELVRKALDDFANQVNNLVSLGAGAHVEYSTDASNYASSIRASSDLGNRKRRHASLSSLLNPILLTQTTTQNRAFTPATDLFTSQDTDVVE